MELDPEVLRIDITYGFPHQDIRAVEEILVPKAVAARAIRAEKESGASIININGVRADASDKEVKENSFRFLNVVERGP
jgi:hypothetical protein